MILILRPKRGKPPTRLAHPKSRPPPERLLTTAQTVAFQSVSASWLAKSRMRGDGPRFVKVGRSVRYRESALRDYVRFEDAHVHGRALGPLSTILR